MKSYPSLNSDTGCSNGWSSICDLFVAWALDVRDLLFLHSYIGRTPFSYPCVLCKKVRPIRAKIRYLFMESPQWTACISITRWNTLYLWNMCLPALPNRLLGCHARFRLSSMKNIPNHTCLKYPFVGWSALGYLMMFISEFFLVSVYIYIHLKQDFKLLATSVALRFIFGTVSSGGAIFLLDLCWT